MTNVIVTTEEHTIVIDGNEQTQVVVQEDVTYTIETPAAQGPPGTVTLAYITTELISTDTSNNISIGTDGKLVSLPQLSSTNW